MTDSYDNNDDWIDCGYYWLNKNEQGTQEWINARRGKLTSSNFGTAAGHSPYRTADSYFQEWKSGLETYFTPEALSHMARGTRLEPYVRQLYESITGTQVKELGLAVPKYNTRIGASTDGIVLSGNGCIEIKCPIRMYRNLKNTSLTIKERIPHCHYDQIQGTMSILHRSWCDYIVYVEDTKEIYILTVNYDDMYWKDEMYPKLSNFLSRTREDITLESSDI